MTTVQNTVTDPGGEPLSLVNVRITLQTGSPNTPGYTSTGEISGTFTVATDQTGHWSASLTPNSTITPANTYYQVVENQAVSNIVVPATGGPYELSEVLVTTPPTPSAVGITGVQVAAGGTIAGVRPEINLIGGTGVTVTAVDNAGSDRVDVTLASTSTGAVTSVNGQTGTVVLAAADVSAIPASAEAAPSGVATLDASGHLTAAQAANLLTAANNLSDVPAPATARTNLGVAYETNAANLQPDGVATLGTHGAVADSGHVHPLQPWQFLITAYGAVGDLNCVVDAVTNGTAVVTSASGKFTAGMVGQTVVGKGFLTSGVTSLVTTVASYQSPTQVTLSTAATSSATGLQMTWGTDDTTHIQAAIDAAMAFESPLGVAAQVITPLAPGGLGFMVAGPLKSTDTQGNAVYNSQLTTGLHSDRLPGKVIEFVGPVDAGATRHWNQDYPTFTGGSWFSAGVFSSQAAQATSDPHSIANGGNPSCLGGPTGKFGYGTTGTNPQFNNLTVRMVNMSIINTHSSSGWSYCPFNFYGTARAHLVRCGFGTAGVVQYYTGAGGSGGNTDFSNPATFSGGASLGGLLPAAGNNADSVIEDCVWNGGFTYGPLLGEHAACKGINRSLYNWIGVNVAGTYGDGGTGAGSLHAIDLGQWCVEACSYHLGVWGAGAAGIGPYVYGTLDTEGTVQVRGVTNIAANLQALSGELHLAGSPSAPTFTFPTNLHLVKDTQTRGPVASPSYTLGTAQINTYWRDATVTISGGTVTAVKVSALAGGATAPTMTTLAGVTSGTFRVPAGCWWEIDGTVAPTSMQWILD